MTVYLIHFDTPYRHARHYLGQALKNWHSGVKLCPLCKQERIVAQSGLCPFVEKQETLL